MKLKNLKLGDFFQYRYYIDEPTLKGEDGTLYCHMAFEAGPIEEINGKKMRLCRTVGKPHRCIVENLDTEVQKLVKTTYYRRLTESEDL